MKIITLQKAADILAGQGYEISGGNFETLADFVSYYEHHGRPLLFGKVPPFLAGDLAELLGLELDDPREVAAALDTLTA